jgi:hypothetical protein
MSPLFFMMGINYHLPRCMCQFGTYNYHLPRSFKTLQVNKTERKKGYHFSFSFFPPSHYNVLLRKKKCNKVWQIFSHQLKWWCTCTNTLLLTWSQVWTPSDVSLITQALDLVSGFWYLKSEQHQSINTDKQLVQSLNSESELWTQQKHTLPSHPFYKFQYFHYLPNESLYWRRR